MDDYNTSMLSEAKNEYCIRLLNILTPLVIEGLKSILKEADDLCIKNDEESKYLMTFQNFLSRVPKWNNDIIEEETNRIISKSSCNYLEDLLTCVHITQLKVLTSIRVGSKQKKIDLDIPKLHDFVHKIYIKFARKVYSNVYLFEKNIQPLIYQKNMRECETICKECILDVIRESIPVERILRSYIDESVEEEIVEEVKETLEVDISQNIQEDKKETEKEDKNSEIKVKKADEKAIKVETPVLTPSKEVKKETKKEVAKEKETKKEVAKEKEVKEVEGAIKKILETTKPPVPAAVPAVPKSPTKLSFCNTDIEYNKETMEKKEVNAPKTIERLERIAAAAHKKRKEEDAAAAAAEAAEYDDEKIKIFREGPSIKLDTLDIHDLEKEIKLKPDIKNEIEVLTR